MPDSKSNALIKIWTLFFLNCGRAREKLTGRNTPPAVRKTKGLRNSREEPPHPRWREKKLFFFFLSFFLSFFFSFFFSLFSFLSFLLLVFLSYFFLKSSNTPLLFLNFHFHLNITLQKKEEKKKKEEEREKPYF